MPTEKYENSTREVGCWSFNVAEGYQGALENCRVKLQEAVKWLDGSFGIVNPVNAQKEMKQAQGYMDEANRWFNQANNQHFRIQALVNEVKLLRKGQAITYPEGHDPIEDSFERITAEEVR